MRIARNIFNGELSYPWMRRIDAIYRWGELIVIDEPVCTSRPLLPFPSRSVVYKLANAIVRDRLSGKNLLCIWAMVFIWIRHGALLVWQALS